MSPNWLIAIGPAIWGAGELWGLHRNMAGTGTRDTTTDWVWWLESRNYIGIPVRILIVVLAVVVVGHLLFHW